MATSRMKLPGTRIVIAAVLVTAIVTGLLLVLPLYQTSTIASTFPDGRSMRTSGSATLIAVNGPAALVALLVPVAISAFPLLFRGQSSALAARTVATILLMAFVFLGSMTIGFFYLPSVIIMGVAVVWLLATSSGRHIASRG